jgi:hypothetical protein
MIVLTTSLFVRFLRLHRPKICIEAFVMRFAMYYRADSPARQGCMGCLESTAPETFDGAL